MNFDFKGYPQPGPVQVYKGRYLIGSKHPDVKNRSFFETVKLAIDLTEKLPAKLQADAKLIKVIIYDPPSKHRKKDPYASNTTAVYTYGPNLFQMSPLVIERSTKWVAPVSITYALAASSVYAREQRTLIDLKQKIEAASDPNSVDVKNWKKKFDYLWASIAKTDQAIVDATYCPSALAEFAARKALETNATKRDAFAKNLSSRGCF